MEYKKRIRRVPSMKEVVNGKEMCNYFRCPECGKEYKNSELSMEWPIPGDLVTCDCGEKFYVE